MCIEIAVIVKMSQELAADLNSRVTNGMEIHGAMESRELNSGHSLHGTTINTRVFLVRGESGIKCTVIVPPQIKGGKKEFIIPSDKEYEEVTLDEF